MINYVLGFATDGQQIVLIRKNKPDYMKGKLNGIGGKIEQSERPIAALIREFKEETGVESKQEDWHRVGYMGGDDWGCYIFVSNVISIKECKTMESEQVEFHLLKGLIERSDLMRNLRVIVPAAILSLEDPEFELQINYQSVGD